MQDDGSHWSEVELDRFLTCFSDPRFAHLVRHWLALRQEDAVPSRGAVDPTRFRDLLDIVWLLERHADGSYRYRLAGQTIVEIHGGIRRGADTASLFSLQALGMFRPRWEAVLDRGQLVRADGVVTLAGDNRTARVERLMLPLRGDGGEVSVILGATSYERPRGYDVTATDFPPTDIRYCRLEDLPLGSCR